VINIPYIIQETACQLFGANSSEGYLRVTTLLVVGANFIEGKTG